MPKESCGAEEHNLPFNSPLTQGATKIPRVWFSSHPQMSSWPPLPQPLSITRVFELVQSLLGHTTWLTEAMGNSNEGTAYWLVPFTRMERQDTLPGLPTSPPRQTECQDSHNVAMTRSTDTQCSGTDTPRREPQDARQQWVLGREEAANAPLGGAPAVSAGDNTFHTGYMSPRMGCGGP